MLSHRSSVVMVLMIVLGLVLSACAPVSAPAAAPTAVPTTAPAATAAATTAPAMTAPAAATSATAEATTAAAGTPMATTEATSAAPTAGATTTMETTTATPAAAATTPSTAATTAPAAAGGGNKTFVLVPKNLGNPYFDTANKGAQQAAKELGVTVNYQGPATADATQQIQLLNSLIAQKVSGLAISADDADALVPVGKQAASAGIPVVSFDSAIAPAGRLVHVNQAQASDIAMTQLKMASDLAGPQGGKIAILSATSTAPNQNQWIALMKQDLSQSQFSKLQLVDTVYGDDEDTKSYNEAQGLLQKYPDLKVIIAPTTVGIAAAARAVQDAKQVGKVFVTGLGTPNQMRDYVKSGASPQFALWNPSDLGYLAIYTLNAIASGQIKGQPGDKFTAGKLGSYTVDQDGTVLLGPPTVFNKDNIDQFNF